ncbi:MAG: proprotein convertase P-domain-containing protein [Planctomycetota bacterium]
MNRLPRSLWITLLVLGIHSISSGPTWGQAGLRDSLDKLDTNGNGDLEPDEITPLARPYLERIAEARRMSLDRPNDIAKLQEAARIYYALQNGVSRENVRPDRQGSMRGFGPSDDEVMVPQFGLAEVKYPYTPDDVEEAEDTLRKYDRDRDGYLNRYEARRARWSRRDPFEMDLNEDDRLSKLELTQRYARRRLLEDDASELIQKARRVGNGIRESEGKERDDPRGRNAWWARGGSSFWLTASMMGRFDANKNGRLENNETQELGLPVGQIDIDRNNEISRSELIEFVQDLQDKVGDPADGLPSWFFELDTNADQQVSIAEFADEWSDQRIEEFASLDLNQDGLLTSSEVIRSKAMTGGEYATTAAEVIPPKRTIISEIEVTDDVIIGDLNVQVSITHSNNSHLDAFLTGPDGQRIELFTEVGGRDDNFKNTIFDDQAREPITKARPPFEGTYLPEGLLKRQPGLSAFNGKNLKGIWQLVIRATRSDRFGMLHRWSLQVRPEGDMLDRRLLESSDENGSTTSLTSSPAFNPRPSESRDWSGYGSMSRERSDPYPPQRGDGRPERNDDRNWGKAKSELAEVGKRLEAAVKSGRMTKEQAKRTWEAIAARAKAREAAQSD